MLEILITTLVSAIVGFSVWFLQSRIEQIKRAQEALHQDRRKVYVQILEPFIRALMGVNDPKESDKALKRLASFDHKKTAIELNLFGSDDVVRAFNDFMQYIYSIKGKDTSSVKPATMLSLWGKLLIAIRKDLGVKDTTLNEREMLESWITDVRALLE